MKEIFVGSAVALITPFKGGEVDYNSLEKIINFQIENGTKAIVILGTTGEATTLTTDEKIKIIKFSKQIINNKIKLIVGTGSNNTQTAIEQSQLAEKLGADAVLVITPYYNKCTQQGLIEHFSLIAHNISIPMILYNVPGRTGVNILPDTLEELIKIKNVVGIKEASGNISQILEICHRFKDKIAIYSGDDSLNYLFLTLDGKGVISVTANIYPQKVSKLNTFGLKGNWSDALKLHNELYEVNKKLFCEVNPIPIKFACEYLGLCQNELRLPLTTLSKDNQISLQNLLIK